MLALLVNRFVSSLEWPRVGVVECGRPCVGNGGSGLIREVFCIFRSGVVRPSPVLEQGLLMSCFEGS